MQKCSPAEIAEKRRIAIEKLNARKMQSSASATNTKINFTHPFPSTAPATTSSLKPRAGVENKPSASSFLNDIKTLFPHRKEARDSVHPYQRPVATPAPTATTKITTTTSPVNKTNVGPVPNKTSQLALSPPPKQKPAAIQSVTCKVYMVSAVRFAVQPSSYNVKLIEVFKGVPSKAYDAKTHIWSFALSDYKLLQQRVGAMKPYVVIGTIPQFVLNLCTEPAKSLDRSCLASIEPTLAEKLLPFQQEGVCFAIAQHGRIMICDEMGLGKTFQALAVADFYRDSWPLLICTTATTREGWSAYVRQLLPSVPLHYVQLLNTQQQYIGDVKVLITSYNMMERHATKLLERKFGFLIFDESHALKNLKAKCTSVAARLCTAARHVLMLSGTPALSRPLELFSQLQMIDAKLNYVDFTTRYCDGKQNNFGWDATGQSNMQELNVVLKMKYMIRRTKAEVMPEMAEKYREIVVLDPALVWTNDDTKQSLSAFAKNMNASKGREKDEILLQFYAKTASVKARAVCAYLKTLIKDDIKFIVFAHHRVMMDAITVCLVKLNANFIRIDGSTKNEIRAEHINTFQNKSACKVAVLSLKACNSGITLTAAEMIVFAELDWNPSTLAQAESRAHRIGQEKPVTCRYLMATKTADDFIWDKLKFKQDVLNSAGIFCEDLQEATHTAGPTTSNKILNYFSPDKVKSPFVSVKQESQKSPQNSNNKAADDSVDLLKELEGIDEIFNGVDDDDFF